MLYFVRYILHLPREMIQGKIPALNEQENHKFASLKTAQDDEGRFQ